MRRSVSVGWIAVVLMGLVACAGYKTGYFKGHVNEATEEMVAKRYGPSYQIEQREALLQTVLAKSDDGFWACTPRNSNHEQSGLVIQSIAHGNLDRHARLA